MADELLEDIAYFRRTANAKNEARDFALNDVERELIEAQGNWPPFNSAHEGYGVLLEELEAIQVAAMGLRFAIEVCNEGTGRK